MTSVGIACRGRDDLNDTRRLAALPARGRRRTLDGGITIREYVGVIVRRSRPSGAVAEATRATRRLTVLGIMRGTRSIAPQRLGARRADEGCRAGRPKKSCASEGGGHRIKRTSRSATATSTRRRGTLRGDGLRGSTSRAHAKGLNFATATTDVIATTETARLLAKMSTVIALATCVVRVGRDGRAAGVRGKRVAPSKTCGATRAPGKRSGGRGLRLLSCRSGVFHGDRGSARGRGLGVLVLLASKSVHRREMYDLIDWRLIVLIAGMISFGTAMTKTHADEYLAGQIVQLVGHYGGLAVLAGFFVLTVALTQPMSNQAAALGAPHRDQEALAIASTRDLAVTVNYAASAS